MKKLLAALSVMTACAGLTINSLAADQDKTEFLYIQSAKSAIIKETSPDSYTLTLKDIQPNVVCFSERPKRIAKTISTKQFIHEWMHPPSSAKDSFKDDAPNADLNGINVTSQEQVNTPLEISNPQYNGSTKTLTYTINPLNGGKKISAMQLDYVSLIIDNDPGICTRCRPR